MARRMARSERAPGGCSLLIAAAFIYLRTCFCEGWSSAGTSFAPAHDNFQLPHHACAASCAGCDPPASSASPSATAITRQRAARDHRAATARWPRARARTRAAGAHGRAGVLIEKSGACNSYRVSPGRRRYFWQTACPRVFSQRSKRSFLLIGVVWHRVCPWVASGRVYAVNAVELPLLHQKGHGLE